MGICCGKFCKKDVSYETQVEPFDSKADLIGRPLHEVAEVQARFGYHEDNTRWRRQSGSKDSSWDTRAKQEMLQRKKIGRSQSMLIPSGNASSALVENPADRQNVPTTLADRSASKNEANGNGNLSVGRPLPASHIVSSDVAEGPPKKPALQRRASFGEYSRSTAKKPSPPELGGGPSSSQKKSKHKSRLEKLHEEEKLLVEEL